MKETMKISDYIVPIFKKEKEFSGTGFISGNILITAAHVVNSSIDYCEFCFKNEFFSITCENLLWYEYIEKGHIQGENNQYSDLVMYKLTNIDSPLTLAIPDLTSPCFYQGFSFNEKNKIIQLDTYDIVLDNKICYYFNIRGKCTPIRNCFQSSKTKDEICTAGNSGGPLFQGNEIVGMLVGTQEDYIRKTFVYRFIKSEYILKKINEVNDNQDHYINSIR